MKRVKIHYVEEGKPRQAVVMEFYGDILASGDKTLHELDMLVHYNPNDLHFMLVARAMRALADCGKEGIRAYFQDVPESLLKAIDDEIPF